MAIRVIDTLTRSPRSVALAKGPAPPVPSYWRSVTFAGMRFLGSSLLARRANPGNVANWTKPATPPGATFSQSAVTLSTDTRPIEFPSCPYIPPIPKHPSDGVQVDSGLRVEPMHLSFSAHCLDLHGLTACPASSPGYSILVLRVTVPGRIKPVFVSIGLAGNGMIARTILYSLPRRNGPGAQARTGGDGGLGVGTSCVRRRAGCALDSHHGARSSLSQEIDQFAVDLAAADGNSHPHRVIWVATTRDAADNFFNGGPPGGTSGGPPVYALVISGGGEIRPRVTSLSGQRVSLGSLAMAIVEQSSWMASGQGVGDAVDGKARPNLSRLGTPETDLLSGIHPMTTAQFRAEIPSPVGHLT